MPEYKSLPQFTKEITDRTVTGVFCVHGNVDSGGDKSFPGVFGDFTAQGRKRVVYLWQHDYTQPPIAKIDSIYEVSRADLPPEVLQYAPEATGGTAVKRTYLEDAFADRVLGALRNDAIREMSYAFELKDWKYEAIEQREIRNLFKSEILDVSDVTWGMNPATLGSKNLPLETEHHMALAAMSALITRYQGLADLRAKEGRMLSDANRKRIASAVEVLQELLAATEPKADTKEAQRLFAQWQQIQAQFNGAMP